MLEKTLYFFDAWAKTQKGAILHFEVICPLMDAAIALTYARTWLKDIGHRDAEINAQSITLSHQISPIPPELVSSLREKDWAIIGLEGCQNLPDCANYPNLT